MKKVQLLSHDIKSSLHVIQFCIQQLSEDRNRIHDDRYLEFLRDKVVRSLNDMDALSQILSSRSEDSEIIRAS